MKFKIKFLSEVTIVSVQNSKYSKIDIFSLKFLNLYTFLASFIALKHPFASLVPISRAMKAIDVTTEEPILV